MNCGVLYFDLFRLQSVFWAQYGSAVAMALIVLFGLTSAFSTGSYCKEAAGGHLEILSTFPGVTHLHSAAAWWLCSIVWTSVLSFLACIIFARLLDYTSFVIPALNLLIFGISMGKLYIFSRYFVYIYVSLFVCNILLCLFFFSISGPLTMIIGCIVKRADAVVVLVPTVTFVLLLPGQLYAALAYDCERAMWFELLLGLLPPSNCAMLLQFIANNESMLMGIKWTSVSPIAGTPMYYFTLLLVLDIALYSLLAAWTIGFSQSTVPVKFHRIDGTLVQSSESSNAFCVACIDPLYRCCAFALFKLGVIQDPGPYSSAAAGESPNATSAAEADTNSDQRSFLKVRSLSKEYTTRVQPVSVLSEVSANLLSGEITSLLGSNGAGYLLDR